jgi:DoxX-like protein
MEKRNPPAGRAGKIIYWIATIWLALGMLATGTVQLLKAKNGQGGADMITHLGYPVYLLSILGVWKILGVVAVLIPKFPLLKEWAYAGFFFVMSGAIFSHIASGDSISEIFPSLLLLILTVVSWYFRPANRRIMLAGQ